MLWKLSKTMASVTRQLGAVMAAIFWISSSLVGTIAFTGCCCDAFSSSHRYSVARVPSDRKHRLPSKAVATRPRTRLNMATPKVGLIGLPNVGKSTLFNAVVRTADLARAGNFPFCTIDPNTAQLAIPDPVLPRLSDAFVASGTIRPARLELVDVAGLVEGASRGEGLGNQFLAVIRESSVVVHVLRYFADPGVVRHNDQAASGASSAAVVDPVFDAAIVDHELLLADQAHVARRLERIKGTTPEKLALEKALASLEASVPVRCAGLTQDEEFAIKSMGLLTLKPVIYAFNVDETDFTANRASVVQEIRSSIMPQIRSNNGSGSNSGGSSSSGSVEREDDFVLVSARLEEDLLSLGGPDEQGDYMAELMSLGSEHGDNDREEGGASNQGHQDQYQRLLSYNVLPTLVCRLLSLSLCYTGPGVPPERSQTTKSWLFGSSNASEESSSKVLTAFGLAGKIHGELQRGFLRAEVVSAEELLRFDSFQKAREEGCVRTEGKDYKIREGDTVLIKWKESSPSGGS